VQGALGGFVVLVLAVMGTYVFNRLWQHSLLREAGPAVAAAERLGLRLQPFGFGPRLKVSGVVDGQTTEIVWTGGFRGAHTVVRVGEHRLRYPLATTASALDELLATEE
jgi:hypothetical protein